MILGVGEPEPGKPSLGWIGVVTLDMGGLLVDRLVSDAVRSN